MPQARKLFFPISIHAFRAPIVNISRSSNKKPVNGIMDTTSYISTTNNKQSVKSDKEKGNMTDFPGPLDPTSQVL